MRPIGIGETFCHIIAKAVLVVTRDDIQDVAGSIQHCAGMVAEVKLAVHAVRDCFQCEDTDVVLHVDAGSAFKTLN